MDCFGREDILDDVDGYECGTRRRGEDGRATQKRGGGGRWRWVGDPADGAGDAP